MKNAKHELLLFLAGVAMLIAGLFYFSLKVNVSSSFFGGLGFGGFYLSGGLLFIPLIAGIIWWFASGGKIGGKICTIIGAAIILLYIIFTVRIWLEPMHLYNWIIMLVLIFGGIGLILRVLVGGKDKDDTEEGYHARKKNNAKKTEAAEADPVVTKADAVNAELEEMKKNL